MLRNIDFHSFLLISLYYLIYFPCNMCVEGVFSKYKSVFYDGDMILKHSKLTCRVHEGSEAQDVVPAPRQADVSWPAAGPGPGVADRGPGAVGGVRVNVSVLELSRGRFVAVKSPDLIPEDAADGAHGRHVVLVAHAVRQQPVPDLPGEDARVALLVVPDALHHGGGGDPGLAAADGAGQDGAGVVVTGQDFRHAAVRDAQLAADVAGPHPELRQLHDPQPHRVRERPAVDEEPAELVHLPVALLCTHGTDGREFSLNRSQWHDLFS